MERGEKILELLLKNLVYQELPVLEDLHFEWLHQTSSGTCGHEASGLVAASPAGYPLNLHCKYPIDALVEHTLNNQLCCSASSVLRSAGMMHSVQLDIPSQNCRLSCG